jgi:hypothetical protein
VNPFTGHCSATNHPRQPGTPQCWRPPSLMRHTELAVCTLRGTPVAATANRTAPPHHYDRGVTMAIRKQHQGKWPWLAFVLAEAPLQPPPGTLYAAHTMQHTTLSNRSTTPTEPAQHDDAPTLRNDVHPRARAQGATTSCEGIPLSRRLLLPRRHHLLADCSKLPPGWSRLTNTSDTQLVSRTSNGYSYSRKHRCEAKLN